MLIQRIVNQSFILFCDKQGTIDLSCPTFLRQIGSICNFLYIYLVAAFPDRLFFLAQVLSGVCDMMIAPLPYSFNEHRPLLLCDALYFVTVHHLFFFNKITFCFLPSTLLRFRHVLLVFPVYSCHLLKQAFLRFKIGTFTRQNRHSYIVKTVLLPNSASLLVSSFRDKRSTMQHTSLFTILVFILSN